MSASLTLADACPLSYLSFWSTDSYWHATWTSHILFNSSQRADSSGSIPDSIRPLVVELSSFLTLAARAAPTQT